MFRFDPLTLTMSIDTADLPPFELVPKWDFSGISLQLSDFSGTSPQLSDFSGTVTTAEQRTATPIMLPKDKNPKTFHDAMIHDQI